MKLRRYRNPDGTEYYTYEMPVEVFDNLVIAGKHEEWYAALYKSGRKARDARDAIIRSCLQEKWKPMAIAVHVGMSITGLRKAKRRLERERAEKDTGIAGER